MLFQSLFQYDSNVLLAGIISLLIVILFVLLLHIYAKWFLFNSRRRPRNSLPILPPPRLRYVNSYRFDTTLFASPCKGLDPSVIASIPLFVHESEPMDCVVCLSAFEERQIGRRLTKCGHEFHVECIDMWLKSHSNCPICRAIVEGRSGSGSSTDSDDIANGLTMDGSGHGSEVQVVVEVSRLSESRVGEMVDSSLSSQVVALGDSFKRMLSRNRLERKVLPSASLDAQAMT